VLLGWLLIVPLYLQAAAWQSGFGLYGWYTLAFGESLDKPWLTGWRGAIWVHAVASIPWVTLIVGLASRQVEPQLEEAALLDTSPLQVFWRITLRRVWPALGLAALWVALQTATDMTVTDLYQVRTYAEEVYIDFAAPADLTAAPIGPWISAAMLGLLVAMALVLWAGCVQRSAKLLPKRPREFELGAWRWPAAIFALSCIVVVVGMPLFNLVYKCGVAVQPADGHLERSWSAAKFARIIAAAPVEFYQEIFRSLIVASGAATIAVVVALALAWTACYGRLASVPAVLVTAIAIAIPGPLLGIGLIYLLNNTDLPDHCFSVRFGFQVVHLLDTHDLPFHWLYNSLAAPMIAQAIRALPLATFIAWVAFRSIPAEQIEAAALDGATAWRKLWQIALPQRRAAIAGAWGAGFVVAMNELPATVLLEVPGRATLPIAVFQLLHGSGEDRLAGIVLFMVLAFGAILAVTFALRGRISRVRQFSPRGV
jgi:iron(III) transport system permease protein